VVYRPAVHFENDVAGAEARGIGVRVARHLVDERGAGVRGAEIFGDLRSQRGDVDTGNRAALDFTVFQEIVHHVAREVARDGEPDSLVAAALAEDGGVDPDQLAARVDERAAGVARIDGRVGLNEVLVRGQRAAERSAQ